MNRQIHYLCGLLIPYSTNNDTDNIYKIVYSRNDCVNPACRFEPEASFNVALKQKRNTYNGVNFVYLLLQLIVGLFDQGICILVAACLLAKQYLALLIPFHNLRHSVYAGNHHCKRKMMEKA